MNKLKNDNGYRIGKNDGWYDVTIASTKYNQYRHYEYDAGCATYEELEQYLKDNDFKTVATQFRDECVYLDCVERIY